MTNLPPNNQNKPNNKAAGADSSGWQQALPDKQPSSQLPPPKSEEKIKEEITSLGITPPSKTRRSKVVLALLGMFFILVSIPLGVYLVKQRQEIRKEASCPECKSWSEEQGKCVWDFNNNYTYCCCKYDPGSDDNCKAGSDWRQQYCESEEVGGDYTGCWARYQGRSCPGSDQGISWCADNKRCICGNDSFVHEIEQQWCDEADQKQYCCKNGARVADPGGETCGTNLQCPGDVSPPPTSPTGAPTGNCPSGKSPGMDGFVNPDPNCESQGGVYCHDNKRAYCCYNENGDPNDGYEYCAEGQIGNCVDLGNGRICVKNNWSGTIFKRTSSTDVFCPFSGGTYSQVFSGTVSGSDTCNFPKPDGESIPAKGKIFSLGPNECGQIDGPCGSCKPSGCGGVPPTTPTPTLPPGEFSCQSCGVFDQNWQPVNPNQLKPGDQVYFATYGSASGITITKAKIRVTLNGVSAKGWQLTQHYKTIHGVKWFYIPLTTIQPGTYLIEALVYSPELKGWR